jgi:uncharacterized protein
MAAPATAPSRYAVTVNARLFLGHGASGTAASMKPFIDGLLARGLAAEAIDLPRRRAEAALPAFHAAVPREPDVVVGGHSFGGRVASLAAAEPGAPYRALITFSYPLHAPGRHELAEARVAHWSAIRCPVLLLSGESDPFARIDLLREMVTRIQDVELVTYPRLGHTLRPVLDDALDLVAAVIDRLADPAPDGSRPDRAPEVSRVLPSA